MNFVKYHRGMDLQTLNYTPITKEELVLLFKDFKHVLVFDTHESWKKAVSDIINANNAIMSSVTANALCNEEFNVLRNGGHNFIYSYKHSSIPNIFDIANRILIPCIYDDATDNAVDIDIEALFDAVFDIESDSDVGCRDD